MNQIFLSTAVGLSLFGATAVLAEHRDTIGDTVITDRGNTVVTDRGDTVVTDRGVQPRHSDLSGGFYEDKYKADDWFYDFYDSPYDRDARVTDSSYDRDARVADSSYDRDARVVERSDRSSIDSARYAERARLADAAHPIVDSRLDSRRDFRAREYAYGSYYDEPWYYEPRDSAYTVPRTRGQADSYDTAAHHDEFLKGRIDALKQVRNRDSGGQNSVALVRLNTGGRVITDLGPTHETLDLALTEGDTIEVWGDREGVGPYSVLMAHDIKSGVNRVRFVRDIGARPDYRQVDGRIEQFRDIRVARTGQVHRTAAIRMADDRFALADFGPSTADNVPANAAPGDRIMASGPMVQIGNYPVLFVDRLSINDGAPIRVVRPDGDYVEPARRPFEASQEERLTDPTCVGGGCEGNAVNRATPRNPHSNAVDGTVRSRGR